MAGAGVNSTVVHLINHTAWLTVLCSEIRPNAKPENIVQNTVAIVIIPFNL